MSIQELRRGEVEEGNDLDISDLDLSPLFQEPEQSGIVAKFLPWVNLGVMVVILIILIFK